MIILYFIYLLHAWGKQLFIYASILYYNNSPIYAHILSPFAQFWVNMLPTWLAPNTITLSGLSLPLAMSVLSVVYNPSMGAHGPPWLALCSGIALFIYQV
jgi:ethanolaminephosphotransferase